MIDLHCFTVGRSGSHDNLPRKIDISLLLSCGIILFNIEPLTIFQFYFLQIHIISDCRSPLAPMARSPNQCGSGVVMLPFTSDPRQHLHYRSKPKNVQMPDSSINGFAQSWGHRNLSQKTQVLLTGEAISHWSSMSMSNKNASLSDSSPYPPKSENHIWRLLLVQPRKFNMYHINQCTKNNWLYPEPGRDQTSSWTGSLCARCQDWLWGRLYTNLAGIYESPLRSKWARQSLNPFLCDTCHWDVVGRNMDRLDPALKLLPCICTRRENLDVLLVNKRIHHEAAYVF